MNVSALFSRTVNEARAAGVGVLRRAVWSYAAVPSGPLGWLSIRTVFPLTSTTLYLAMAEALQLTPQDELLDVACGSGAFLARYATQVNRAAGVDLSDVQIDLARKRLSTRIADGTADIRLGDAATLPWPDRSFTVVTCMAAMEVFPDPARVLAEIHRVLRPGGRLVANFGEEVPPQTETHRLALGLWVWAEGDVRRLLHEADFTDITWHYSKSFGRDPLSVALSRLAGPAGKDLRIVHALKA